MQPIDYGKKPGMMPAPMITRTCADLEAVEKVIVIETEEWKAYYRLSNIHGTIERGKDTHVVDYARSDATADFGLFLAFVAHSTRL